MREHAKATIAGTGTARWLMIALGPRRLHHTPGVVSGNRAELVPPRLPCPAWDAVGPLPADSSAEAVFTLLRRHHASLYQKLLLFHPLELDEMHALTKAAKIKLGKDGLKKLLAQHGVFVSTNTKGKAGGGIKDLNGAKFKRW